MAFYEQLDLTLNELIIRGFSALGIIAFGIFLGQVIDYLLKKLSEKIDLKKHIKKGFIDLTLFIIRWSIYIIFINIGLNQLKIPAITDYFSVVLIAIPAFTGGLLLLIFGFIFAFYLKKIIKTSEESQAWEFISQAVFFFVLIIFGIYAMKIALIPLNSEITNSIIILISTVVTAGIIYYFIKQK